MSRKIKLDSHSLGNLQQFNESSQLTFYLQEFIPEVINKFNDGTITFPTLFGDGTKIFKIDNISSSTFSFLEMKKTEMESIKKIGQLFLNTTEKLGKAIPMKTANISLHTNVELPTSEIEKIEKKLKEKWEFKGWFQFENIDFKTTLIYPQLVHELENVGYSPIGEWSILDYIKHIYENYMQHLSTSLSLRIGDEKKKGDISSLEYIIHTLEIFDPIKNLFENHKLLVDKFNIFVKKMSLANDFLNDISNFLNEIEDFDGVYLFDKCRIINYFNQHYKYVSELFDSEISDSTLIERISISIEFFLNESNPKFNNVNLKMLIEKIVKEKRNDK